MSTLEHLRDLGWVLPSEATRSTFAIARADKGAISFRAERRFAKVVALPWGLSIVAAFREGRQDYAVHGAPWEGGTCVK